MRYLEGFDVGKPISRIGYGTWQFGSRELGYGKAYSSREADLIVARAALNIPDTHQPRALGRVMVALLKDDTELFKQFSDNPSFKRWLEDTVFSATYAPGA